MSNDLEKYLASRRDELDVEQPDDHLIWEGIRKELHASVFIGNRHKRWHTISRVAAVVIMILFVGYVAFDLLVDRKHGQFLEMSSLDPVLGEREAGYQLMVAKKMEEAIGAGRKGNQVIDQLFMEIQRLDTIYLETMKDLEILGYNEQVVQTIFDTYEKKIYLLELIILENQKSQNHVTEEFLFL
jgi:hypothetical protein